MSSFEDELLQDALNDECCCAFIAERIPQELKPRLTPELIQYFLDVLAEYYASSGLFDTDEDVEIDLPKVAQHLAETAHRERMGDFRADELIFLVDAELDFEQEQQ